jgi:hypothetical protein
VQGRWLVIAIVTVIAVAVAAAAWYLLGTHPAVNQGD